MTQDNNDGGAFGGVDDLYREVILDHFKGPKNKGRLENPSAESEGLNPLCGDQIHITVQIENNQISDIKFEGHGCAISQSAASIMTDLVKGKDLDKARSLTQNFKKMFGIQEPGQTGPIEINEEELGDAIALEGVKKYPVRIKCALLSWNTLLESLDSGLRRNDELKGQ